MAYTSSRRQKILTGKSTEPTVTPENKNGYVSTRRQKVLSGNASSTPTVKSTIPTATLPKNDIISASASNVSNKQEPKNLLQLSQGAQQAMFNAPVSTPKSDVGTFKGALNTLGRAFEAAKSGAKPSREGMLNVIKMRNEMPKEQALQREQEFASSPAGAFGYGMSDRTLGTLNRAFMGDAWGNLVKTGEQAQPGYSTAGKIAGDVFMYSTVGKAVEGMKGLQAIKSPFMRNLVGQQLADTAIQTPGIVLRGITDKKSAGEVAKDVGLQQGQDLGTNLLLGGVEALIKTISGKLKAGKTLAQTDVDTVQKATKEIGGDTTANVDDQLKKLDDYFQQKRTNPLGGKLPKTEPTPLGGKLPKQKISTGIPLGGKPLSFPQTAAKADITALELKEAINNNPLSYKPVNNPDTLKYAQDIVDQNFEAAKRVVKEGESFANATESAMAQDVIRRLQNAKQWDEAFEVMEATARKAKTSGQTIQAFSMWRRMTPEGMLRYADKVIKETGGKMTAEFANKLTEAMKRIEATTDENTLKNAIMRQAGEMPEWAYKSMSSKTADQLKDIAMAQVLSDIADQVPKSVWKKASTVQAMSHLINVKTAARNVLGNMSFGAAEKVSNAIAVPFDWMASKFTGRRTLTMPKFKGTFKAGFEQAKDAAFDASMGIDRTGVSAGKYNVPLGSSFKGKLGKFGEKALKYELNVPDEFFKGQIYDDVLKQQMAAAKVTEATQEMIEYATYRAKYATFQDDSLPANILQGLKKLANMAGGGKKTPFFSVGGHQVYTREFGLGDFLIKYTTVPGNLISRSIEYTPAGLFKILSIAKDASLSGAMKQSEIAITIGRAITGTSMIAMGAALRRKGLIISEDKDRGRNAQSLDQAEGLGNYKVNTSAVERLLDGGDTVPQDGDLLYSYNWIEPLGVQLAIGAEIDKQIQKGGTAPEITFNAGNAAMEEILDHPTLSTIRQMTYQDNVFDVLITPLVQGVSGFVPSPVRQYAQMQDPTARITKGSTPLEGAFNRLKSALPSVNIGGIGFEGRKGLEPKIDPFGREVQYPGGAFNNLINPGQASTYKPSEVTPQLKQLEDLTGQTDFYPRDSAPSYFEHNKERIYLTPDEKTLYMQIEGQEVLRRYKEILAEGVVEQKANKLTAALENAKDKASKMAREEILKQRGLIN